MDEKSEEVHAYLQHGVLGHLRYIIAVIVIQKWEVFATVYLAHAPAARLIKKPFTHPILSTALSPMLRAATTGPLSQL